MRRITCSTGHARKVDADCSLPETAGVDPFTSCAAFAFAVLLSVQVDSEIRKFNQNLEPSPQNPSPLAQSSSRKSSHQR